MTLAKRDSQTRIDAAYAEFGKTGTACLLYTSESLFLFGLMGQLSELITTRQSLLVNL